MRVKIIKTGEVIEVYKSSLRGTYINANDCTTEYKAEEVTKL